MISFFNLSSIYFNTSVVNQFYDPGLMDKEYVMRGNSAILKCSIPSFVADFVYVVAWVDEDGKEILASDDFAGSKTRRCAVKPQKSLSIFPFVSVFDVIMKCFCFLKFVVKL